MSSAKQRAQRLAEQRRIEAVTSEREALRSFANDWIEIYMPFNRMMGALLIRRYALPDDIILSIASQYADTLQEKIDSYVAKVRKFQRDYVISDQLPVLKAIQAVRAGDLDALFKIARESDEDNAHLYVIPHLESPSQGGS